MAKPKKLDRKVFPSGHSPDDFECFGPSAVDDGSFTGTKIADMGCFMQEQVDSNKYYHAAVVKSKKTGDWFVYIEYGRVGVDNPQYQFIQCSSEQEAEREYVKILESKNVKRGVWETHKTLGKRLIPKVDGKGKPKDLYLVRPQATRSTGLPDAKTITSDDGLDKKKVKANGTAKGRKGAKKKAQKDWADKESMSLMRDLNMGTISYTKSTMADSAIPTQKAIDEGRAICLEALKRVKKVGDKVDAQVADRELKQLTRDMYSRIPKKKHRRDTEVTWILSQDNIQQWQSDLDAFESALYTADLGDIEAENPFSGMGIKLEFLSPRSELGKYIRDWCPSATKNVHGWLGKMKVHNVWSVERKNEISRLKRAQEKIAGQRWKCRERPLHQPKRIDLTREEAKLYSRSGTHLMFHGSRSVNVSGILREGFRLPRQLVGVQITGAMFGPGHYTADDWKKSAGYCSLRGSIWAGGSGNVRGRHAFMLICDVALGNMHVANGCYGYTKAPSGHHSVFGKAGASGVMNNEFITYDTTQTKIRYLVEFSANR
jgi:hypothetical protein